MYQAIVFLPLLGAIIAGAIAIVGARRRHPGGEPGDARRMATSTRTAHAAHDEHGHDHEPAAEGSQPAEIDHLRLPGRRGAPVLGRVLHVLASAAPSRERIPVLNWFTSRRRWPSTGRSASTR